MNDDEAKDLIKNSTNAVITEFRKIVNDDNNKHLLE